MATPVIAAQGGEAAIERAHAYDGPIHLLLTDVRMPGKGGPEVARALRGMRPGIRVLYMTGHDDGVLRDVGPDALILHKPFSIDRLLGFVRTVLDE